MVEIIRIEGDGAAHALRVDRLLDDAAEAAGYPFNPVDFNFEARDENGAFLGGLSGYAQLGWLFVKLLALTPEARGQGVGALLLERAEALAREQGFSGLYLDTFEFQAPEFYRKLGYREFARMPKLKDFPRRIWFAKIFDEEPS